MRLRLLTALLPGLLAAPVLAADAPARAVTTVFDQRISYSLPAGFVPAYAQQAGDQYIQEAVPRGESVEAWTQMITLTGARGLATRPGVTPGRVADRIAGGFRRVCPQTYDAIGLGQTHIGPHPAFVVLVRCGSVPGAKPHSETLLLTVIQGRQDIYTLQWAERGPASTEPYTVDRDTWNTRLRALAPMRLCPPPARKDDPADCPAP